MKFLIIFVLFAIPYSLFAAPAAQAVCPVCTAAVGAGLGLSRWLGVDDTISGIWIGGLILSLSLWFLSWISKKFPNIQNTLYKILVISFMYLLVFIPLSWTGNKTDKLVLGTIIGSLAFLVSLWLDKKVHQVRGQQLFNYQKIIFPVSLLAFFSLIMYLVTK